jgi:hypothetical protein
MFSVLQESDHSSQCVAVFPQIMYHAVSLTFITVTTREEELQPNSYEIGKYAPIPVNVLRVCGYIQ